MVLKYFTNHVEEAARFDMKNLTQILVKLWQCTESLISILSSHSSSKISFGILPYTNLEDKWFGHSRDVSRIDLNNLEVPFCHVNQHSHEETIFRES
mmetsp:Transcript_6601/g.10084  ORF Transcript_6601/g.10084 Transcript_6601/m.10084 type:complete len:97 (+) Transcript_6601:175-465(+)